MSAPISEMSTSDQRAVFDELLELIHQEFEKNDNWRRDGVPTDELIGRLAQLSSRTEREVYYAVQYGFHTGKVALSDNDGLLLDKSIQG